MIIVVYFVVIAAAFFFLIVRPQRRRMAAQRALLGSLAVGDTIVTVSGIHATIRRLDDETLDAEIAPGVVVTMARGAVGQRLGPPPDPSTPDPSAPEDGVG